MKSQLQLVESEKNSLLENICTDAPGEGTSKEATLNQFGELMESELQCSVCAELFVEATTLNCSHTFCKYCITMWKKKKKDCPICRYLICRYLICVLLHRIPNSTRCRRHVNQKKKLHLLRRNKVFYHSSDAARVT